MTFDFSSSVTAHLEGHYKDRRFTDFTVVCGTKEFDFHACVIGCHSTFFRTVLQTGETVPRRLELSSVRPEVFALIAESLYTGMLRSIDELNAVPLLEAARCLQVPHAEEQASEWLMAYMLVQPITEHNCLGIWDAANRLESRCPKVAGIKKKACAVVGRFLPDVSKQAAFHELSTSRLIELVSDDTLTVTTENVVYEACMEWVHFDVKARQHEVGEVLSAVRLPLLSTEFLADTVSRDPLIEKSLEACRLLNRAFSYNLSMERTGLAEGAFNERSTRKRKRIGNMVLAVGGAREGSTTNGEHFLSSTEFYDPEKKQWLKVPSMCERRAGCRAAVVNGIVYVLGGWDGKHPVASGEYFNPAMKAQGWLRLSTSMHEKRLGAGIAEVDGKLCLIGGWDGEHSLKSAECFDPATNEMHKLPDMHDKRSACSALHLGGLIYAIGGRSAGSSLKSVECFDPAVRAWRKLPDMSSSRSGCGAAAVHGLIYVVGGRDGCTSLKSAEVYDPDLNEWRTLPDMLERRHGCGVASTEGLIYVLGGRNGAEGRNLKSAECLDPASGQWHALPAMSEARFDCGATIALFE
jgi:kelch-like protein 18